ncbi:MAG TPA: T9SS type A sorting domain-containing protein [Saprospiraceae bacterium]|nr:T9SS type A sorting domain-containing protein [Saprospiraceae bacterium]
MKTLAITLFLSLFSWFFPEEAFPPAVVGHDYSWNNEGSDYYINFSYSNLDTDRCDCSETRSAVFCLNSFQSGEEEFEVTDLDVSGSFTLYPGPGYYQTIYLTTHYHGTEKRDGCLNCGIAPCDPKACDKHTNANNSIILATYGIKNPSGLEATDELYDTWIELTWDIETNIPNANHKYRIYRDNILIDSVAGGVTQYTDDGLTPGEVHTYTVKTLTRDWGVQESSGVSDEGSTFDIGLEASDGDFYGRTKLSWNDIAVAADEIRVERSIPDSTGLEELAIVAGSARAYNDQTGIPGWTYTYYVTPVTDGNTFLTGSETGYSRPNGKIKGHVKSKLNAGVSGVEVNVTLLDSIPSGGFGIPQNCTNTYCAITDAEGYYEIKDIYYYTEAEFRVVPYKSGTIPHEFSPDTIFRTLDENGKEADGVDFTDLTVFTVGGQVTYPLSSTNAVCGVKDVKILVNDLDYGILTDNEGNWSFAIQDEGTYSFKPEFLHHHFEDGAGDPVTTLLILADNTDIDFTDVETDDLEIVVQAGCQASLGDSVEVLVTSPGNCFNETFYTDGNGLLTLEDLPAREYSVEVTDVFDTGNPNISNILDQIGNRPVVIDLTVRDTAETIIQTDTVIITPMSIDTLPNDSVVITPADTMMITEFDTLYGDISPKVRFVYRSPLVITTDFEEAGAEVLSSCTNSEGDNIVIMEQGTSYYIEFEVKELLGTDCYIDTGFLKIYDFISDRGGKAVYVPIQGGIAAYQIDAGEPVVASNPTYHDHEKLLYIIPEVDLIEPEPIEYWVFVTGAKNNTPSFITRTPEIPMVILHDPPGDGSSSFIDEGTSFTSFTTNEMLVGGDAGLYLNVLIGAKVITPFSTNGLSTRIKFEASAGQDQFDRNGIFTTVTFNERFSTSDIENLTGHDGDVYIGAAFNQEFSLSQQLTFDLDSCKGDVDIVPALAVEDFATTFVYTEKHIESTLLPTLSLIKNNILDGQPFSSLSPEDQAEVNNLIADSLSWVNILNKNRIARDSSATFVENISFSAGAPISRESSSDSVTMVSYEYNRFVNSTFAAGIKADNANGIWFDSEVGIMGNFRFSSSINTGNDTTTTRTVGYELNDNDIGDFFSVDVLQDNDYNVPAFRLKLGTTSCPQEPGSQARDRATIQILPPELTNIPQGEAANFVTQITNVSESFETREYGVRVVPTTNPDGLIATLAGQWIGSGEGTFFLTPNQTKNLVLSFDQGPLASLYEDIAVMVYPTCEYPLWQDNGNLTNSDTAWITRIEWQTSCTDIALNKPDDGWLVNQQSNDIIHATFTGYDVNNELFQSMTIQLKMEGQGYVDQITIDKDEISGPFYDVYLDVSQFPDGEYRLRARANCGIEGGITYSSEKTGIIDRSSIAPFGIPTPSDGFLREGQEVSVSFDKLINCDFGSYPHEITLVREDTDEAIPFTTSCFENKLIINTDPPLIDQPSLDGVLVTARVHQLEDLNGNVQEYPTQWSFLVNVSPVFWDPEELVVVGREGQTNSFSAILKNTSLLSKVFSLDPTDDPLLIDYPDWLTPVQTRGTILSEDDYTVDFIVSDALTPGIYQGVVSAMVDDLPVSMNVTFELLAKPVNWAFDPGQYQYTMNVVAQFSLDSTNTNLSADTRDLIGAFVGGQLRGFTNIEYLPELNLYRAFLTIHSNNQGGGGAETVDFRFWHALNGVEYGAVEKLTFTLDLTTGTVANPYILHPQGFHQVIPLSKGWNWISLNVSSGDMSREHIFQNLLNSPAGNSITIKSKSQTTQYSPGSGWSGNLQNLQLGTGYLVNLTNGPDTLRVEGLPSATTIVVPAVANWNWIGFPRLNPEPVDSVLSMLNPAQGNILKGQDKFATFDSGLDAWLGNLKFFTPGAGYKLFLSNAGNIIFDPSRSDGFEVDPSLFEYNMNVTGYADLDMIGERHEEDFIVGAFIDGQCRGTGILTYEAAVDAYRVLMLVNGNVADLGKPIEFRIKNEKSGAVYIGNGQQLHFVADGIFGWIHNPYPFFGFTTGIADQMLEGYQLEQNIPNPAANTSVIGFTIPRTEKLQLNLYDMTGNLLRQLSNETYTAGHHLVQVDLQRIPAGVYYYELRTADFRGVKKLVKQ